MNINLLNVFAKTQNMANALIKGCGVCHLITIGGVR